MGIIIYANGRLEKMNPYITSFLVIQVAHIGSIAICMRGDSKGEFLTFAFIALLIQGAVNTLLHFTFCKGGKVVPFALPLMWASCVLTMNIYCTQILRIPSLLEGGLGSVLLGMFVLAPALLISFMTALIFFLTRKFQKPGFEVQVNENIR